MNINLLAESVVVKATTAATAATVSAPLSMASVYSSSY